LLISLVSFKKKNVFLIVALATFNSYWIEYNRSVLDIFIFGGKTLAKIKSRSRMEISLVHFFCLLIICCIVVLLAAIQIDLAPQHFIHSKRKRSLIVIKCRITTLGGLTQLNQIICRIICISLHIFNRIPHVSFAFFSFFILLITK